MKTIVYKAIKQGWGAYYIAETIPSSDIDLSGEYVRIEDVQEREKILVDALKLVQNVKLGDGERDVDVVKRLQRMANEALAKFNAQPERKE